jgi:hypothetical protein
MSEEELSTLSEDRRPEPTEKKLHQCLSCAKTFAFQSKLRLHANTVHLKLRPFQCDICKSSFGHKCALNFHIKSVHENQKPFQCNFCQSSFGQKSGLNLHIKSVHENLKLFKCELCQAAFNPVFFNLGSGEPRGSAKIFLGSAKFLTISSFTIFEQTKLLKIEQKRVYI